MGDVSLPSNFAVLRLFLLMGNFAPVIQQLRLNLMWWGIIMAVVVDAGINSPPYGLNLFIIQSIQPDISLADIFRRVIPFFPRNVARYRAPDPVPEPGPVAGLDHDGLMS